MRATPEAAGAGRVRPPHPLCRNRPGTGPDRAATARAPRAIFCPEISPPEAHARPAHDCRP